MTIGEILEVFIKTLSDRLAMTVFFLCAILIILAHLLPTKSALGISVNAHIAFVYLAGLFSLLYLATRPSIPAIEGYVRKRTGRKNMKQALEQLGEDDKELLYNSIATRRVAFTADWPDYSIAKSLETRGLVAETAKCCFTIDSKVFKYLTEHPELVGIQRKP